MQPAIHHAACLQPSIQHAACHAACHLCIHHAGCHLGHPPYSLLSSIQPAIQHAAQRHSSHEACHSVRIQPTCSPRMQSAIQYAACHRASGLPHPALMAACSLPSSMACSPPSNMLRTIHPAACKLAWLPFRACRAIQRTGLPSFSDCRLH